MRGVVDTLRREQGAIVCTRTVRLTLRRLGVSRRSCGKPRALTPAQEQALGRYWRAGLPIREIVERLRYEHGGIVGYTTVGGIAKRLGLPSRAPHSTSGAMLTGLDAAAARARWRCQECYALARGAVCVRGHARVTDSLEDARP